VLVLRWRRSHAEDQGAYSKLFEGHPCQQSVGQIAAQIHDGASPVNREPEPVVLQDRIEKGAAKLSSDREGRRREEGGGEEGGGRRGGGRREEGGGEEGGERREEQLQRP